MHKLAADARRASLRVDVVSALPLELAERVVELLDLDTLATARLVCRSWRGLVGQLHDVWERTLATSLSLFPGRVLVRARSSPSPAPRSPLLLVACAPHPLASLLVLAVRAGRQRRRLFTIYNLRPRATRSARYVQPPQSSSGAAAVRRGLEYHARLRAIAGRDPVVTGFSTSEGGRAAAFQLAPPPHEHVVLVGGSSKVAAYTVAGGDCCAEFELEHSCSSLRAVPGVLVLGCFNGTVCAVPLGVDGGAASLAPAAERRWRRTFRGHTSAVCSVDVSVAEDVVVAGGYDGTVRLWRLGAGTGTGNGAALATVRDLAVGAVRAICVMRWPASGPGASVAPGIGFVAGGPDGLGLRWVSDPGRADAGAGVAGGDDDAPCSCIQILRGPDGAAAGVVVGGARGVRVHAFDGARPGLARGPAHPICAGSVTSLSVRDGVVAVATDRRLTMLRYDGAVLTSITFGKMLDWVGLPAGAADVLASSSTQMRLLSWPPRDPSAA